MELITSFPLWFIIFCFALGFAYAWVLYKKDNHFTEAKAWLIRLMAASRFILVSLLSFFLLSPLIKTAFREIEKPIIVIAADNSSSINYSDTLKYPLTAYKEDLNQLKQSLSKDFDVRFVGFGNNVYENPDLKFNDKISDYSELVNDLMLKYSGRNLGAVIVAGDGIYNNGSNPVYSAEKLRVPFYTIALGDTTVKKDLVVSKVNHNRIAFLGNNFPLEIIVDAKQCAGANTILTVKHDSIIVFSRNISVTGNRYHFTVPMIIEAKKKGIQKYSIRLSSIEGEINLANNASDVFIEVLESKQKVLIVANSPHPDLSAFKTAIENNLNYSATVKYAENFAENLSDYQIVIIHQLPSDNTSSKNILNRIKESGVPAFYVLGAQTNSRIFNSLSLGVSISSNINRNNEILPYSNKNFTLFTANDELLTFINQLPPLIAPFGTYSINGQVNVLLQQRIGPVTTEQPLLYFADVNGAKSAVLCGEGFWKWRLNEFEEKGNNNYTNELISKIVQYLLVKEKKTPFRVSGKTHYNENEPLTFEAQLVNPAGQIVNDPDAQMTIYSSSKKEYKYTFSKTSNAYTLNAGIFPAGKYNYVAQVKLGNTNYKDEGEFTINTLQMENTELTANHQMLFAMAQRTGGKMFYPLQMSLIIDEVKAKEDVKPVSYYHKKLRDFISLKSIFALLIILLTIEWFLRKRSGAY
ncbi:MAG TPA: hypothetical protein PKN75_11005 [Bacteroidia bacterium]|nr:hypothetical protein [Bacteroidia bacterium]HNU34107.1 hypothetical protein [Bacteroidia bacterium]